MNDTKNRSRVPKHSGAVTINAYVATGDSPALAEALLCINRGFGRGMLREPALPANEQNSGS